MLRNSIRNKMIWFLLAATIVPIVTSIIITYSFTRDKVTAENINSNSALLFQGKANLLNYLNGISQASLIVYNDEKLFDVINSGSKDYISDKDASRGMLLMIHAAQGVEQAHLYVRKSDVRYLVVQNLPPKRFEGGEAPFVPTGLQAGKAFIEPPHPPSDYGSTSYMKATAASVITLHRSIYDVPSRQELGILSIDIRLDYIKSISEQLYKAGSEDLYILDGPNVIYESGKTHPRSLIYDAWAGNAVAAKQEKGSFTVRNAGFSGVVIYQKMATPYLNWTIIKRIPYGELYKNAREVTLINSGVVMLFLIMTIMATIFISFQLTAPIKKLIRYMNQIQTGNLQVAIDVDRKDEFGILARSFQRAMKKINELIYREYELELASKTNELNALQAQINPHFLNNALQSIGTLALQKQETKIYSLIASLGKMMRYSMNTGESIVSLGRELEYVKAYFELQKQRFGDQLHHEVNVDEQLLPILVPKMILQPLVENYFKHGFGGQISTEGVGLYGELQDAGWLRLEVRDTGRGMPNDQLQSLKQKLEQWKAARLPEDTGIGLMNVAARLKLYYSENAYVEVDNVEPRGFRVVLWIPLHRGDSS